MNQNVRNDNHSDYNYQYKNMNDGTSDIYLSLNNTITTIYSNFNFSSMNFTIVDDTNNVTISSNYVTPIRMTDYDCDITFSDY